VHFSDFGIMYLEQSGNPVGDSYAWQSSIGFGMQVYLAILQHICEYKTSVVLSPRIDVMIFKIIFFCQNISKKMAFWLKT
jgi:hypothetical protein